MKNSLEPGLITALIVKMARPFPKETAPGRSNRLQDLSIRFEGPDEVIRPAPLPASTGTAAIAGCGIPAL